MICEREMDKRTAKCNRSAEPQYSCVGSSRLRKDRCSCGTDHHHADKRRRSGGCGSAFDRDVYRGSGGGNEREDPGSH